VGRVLHADGTHRVRALDAGSLEPARPFLPAGFLLWRNAIGSHRLQAPGTNSRTNDPPGDTQQSSTKDEAATFLPAKLTEPASMDLKVEVKVTATDSHATVATAVTGRREGVCAVWLCRLRRSLDEPLIQA
jgi:hypothetical protein